MNKIKNIYISYWFNELKDNPSLKVYELEDEIKSVIDEPLMYNSDEFHNNIGLPRIQGISKDKKYLFTMSLINAILSISINGDIDNDDVVLLINNNIQLFYDIIKKIYDIKIVYASIKIEMIDDSRKSRDKVIKDLKLSDRDYENISFKCGFIKDNYYINYVKDYSTEYNFNFEKTGNFSENDLFNKSMVTSLEEAKFHKSYLLTVIEINDRYSYNIDKNYETHKDSLRGMIIEIKDILNNKLYDKM